VDAAGATESIRAAIEAAAGRARVRVLTILAAVGTPFARGLNSRGCIGIAHEDKVIRGKDARQALEAASRVSLPSDRAVAEAYSQGFAVDDVRGMRNPVGIAGGRLEAELHIVTDSRSTHANMRQVIRKAGFRLERVLFGPMAAAEAVLADEEKRLGGVHVDVGAGKTSLALYAGGYPRFCRVLPIGSQHITNDLAIGLNTSVVEAERLKRRLGVTDARRPRRRAESPTVEVPFADGSGLQHFPLWRVGLIMQARIEEIFELVSKELDRSGVAAAAGARVVLTGGFCRMTGAREAAEAALGRPVRFGHVEMESALSQFESDPTHAVVLGTISRGLVCREQKLDRRFEEEGWRSFFRRVAGWL
jgi:cell division protein FtsA